MTQQISQESRSVKYTWFFSIIMTVLLIALLLSFVDLKSLVDSWRKLSLLSLFTAGFFTSTTIYCRAIRFRIIFKKNPLAKMTSLFLLTNWHHFFMIVLPAKTGEASFPLLTKKILKEPATVSIIALLIIRLYDFIAILLMVVIGLLWHFKEQMQLSWSIVYFLGLLCIVFQILAFRNDWLIQFSLKLVRLIAKVSSLEFIRKTEAKLEGAKKFFNETLNVKEHLLILLWTIASWIFAAMTMYTLLSAQGFHFDIITIFFFVGGLNLVGLFAFFTIAGIGISELGMVGLLTIAGIEYQQAMQVGIITRLSLMGIMLFVALLNTIVLLLVKRK